MAAGGLQTYIDGGYSGQNILHSLPADEMVQAIERKKLGRSASITPEIAAQIVEYLEDGKSIADISKIKGMPSRTAIYAACHAQPAFRDVIARARLVTADSYMEDAIHAIASIDISPELDQKMVSNIIRREEIVSRNKIRAAESYNPAKYSQKTMSLNANLSVQADADVIADLFTR